MQNSSRAGAEAACGPRGALVPSRPSRDDASLTRMTVPTAVAEATDGLLASLLSALDRIEWVQRHLFPPSAPQLAERLSPYAQRLAEPLRLLEAAPWPDDLRLLRDRLGVVTRQAIELITAFAGAADSGEPIELFRTLRRFAPLQEALYPLSP